MVEEGLKNYIGRISSIFKDNAKKAKLRELNSDPKDLGVIIGYSMAYLFVLNLLKREARVFGLTQEDVNLADIDPEADLIGANRRPEEDYDPFYSKDEESFGYYMGQIGYLLKDYAREAKTEADNPKEGDSDYNAGHLRAYHDVIAIMKKEASLCGLTQEDVHLADIDPDRDLLVSRGDAT